MTDSFLQAQQGAAATNYLATTPDLVKSVSDRQNEMAKEMTAYYNRIVDQGNFLQNQKISNYNKLFHLTKTGYAAGTFINGLVEARKELAFMYDPNNQNKVKSYLSDLAQAELEANANHAEAYTEARKLEVISDDQSDLVNALKQGLNGRIDRSKQLSFTVQDFPTFVQEVKDRYVHELPNGNRIKYGQGDNAEENYLALRGLVELYVQRFYEEGSGYGRAELRAKLLKPLKKQIDGMQIKFLQSNTAAQKVATTEKRAEHLINNITEGNEGQAVVDWIGTYYGYHDRSWRKARTEAFGILKEARNNDQIDAAQVEKILNHSFIARGSDKPVTIRELWKKEATDLQKTNIAANKSDWKSKEDQRLTLEGNFKETTLEGIRESKKPITDDFVNNLSKDSFDRFGYELPFIGTLRQQKDEDDIELDRRLSHIYTKGGQIDSRDVLGFDDEELFEKWKRRSSETGLGETQTAEVRSLITGWTNGYTLETDGKKDKSTKWRTINIQAEDLFWDTYRTEQSLPNANPALSLQRAREKVKTAIFNGELNEFPVLSYNSKEKDEGLAIIKNVQNNPELLNSSEPWEGEQPYLKSALRYYSTGQGAVPNIYRALVRKADGGTGFEIMQRRLKNVGLINNIGKPIPERKLSPALQDLLLYKPNPSKTLQVLDGAEIEEEQKVELEDLLKINNQAIDLKTQLRNEIARRNSVTGVNVAWLEPVDIDQGLSSELEQEVGTLPFAMRPENLQREVAKAFVSDLFPV